MTCIRKSHKYVSERQREKKNPHLLWLFKHCSGQTQGSAERLWLNEDFICSAGKTEAARPTETFTQQTAVSMLYLGMETMLRRVESGGTRNENELERRNIKGFKNCREHNCGMAAKKKEREGEGETEEGDRCKRSNWE